MYSQCFTWNSSLQSAQTLAQEMDIMDVRDTSWYDEYRQEVFKLLEDAEEDGATGLGHVKMGKEMCFEIQPFDAKVV